MNNTKEKVAGNGNSILVHQKHTHTSGRRGKELETHAWHTPRALPPELSHSSTPTRSRAEAEEPEMFRYTETRTE
jgi:hypothetical protein